MLTGQEAAPGTTAFLYDFLMVPGGAESVALHVSRAFPGTDMVLGFIDPDVYSSQLQPAERFRGLVAATTIPGWQALKVMWAFENRTSFLASYDTVVYSGIYAPVAVRHHPAGRNIYYCHTPPRFVYDLREYYQALALPWQRPLLAWLRRHLRPRYEKSVRQMDVVLANSRNVRERLRKFLGLQDVQVLYPPVDVDFYQWLGQDGFYLSTARVEPYKRVELIVRAFTQMPDKRLVVAGGGSDLNMVRQLAGDSPNIRFVGWCKPAQMRELVGNCIATIYLPIDEDFGMSPVESMAAGKPVIGVAQGGLLETVVHGQTGWLVAPDDLDGGGPGAVASIAEAVGRIDARTAQTMRISCEERSRQFGQDVFNRGLAVVMEASR
jgi:glycosyltransferase involved in cell wall biosynthesis